MRILLVSHEACRAHRPGAQHPERPARLDSVLAGVRDCSPGVQVLEAEAPRAGRRVLERLHAPAYVEAIERLCAAGGGPLDPDTAVVPASWEAALRAVGAGPEAVEQLSAGRAKAAFLAVRPPGHHAMPARALGFCLFNNLALTAARLVEEGERVAVIDWDVHHGNGTQSVFYSRDEVLYVSLHQFPAYPGTGWLDETGTGRGAGTTLNFPFPPGTAGDVYREAFGMVEAVLRRFDPDWVLVSAGYDAHRADPLAGLALVEADYAAMAASLAEVAPGRLILFLEGGYNLPALQASVAATVRGLAGGEHHSPGPGRSPPQSWRILERVAEVISGFWQLD
ncbi:MAG: histone deacetylase [Actinomycetota bacterium]|nr:histone deacetylase [Actinomycetota bacterium]